MVAVSAGVAVFLTLSGAFGTAGAPAWERLGYWFGLLLLGSALSLGAQRALLGAPTRRLWRRGAVLALGMSAVMLPVVYVATHLLFGGGWSLRGLAGLAVPVLAVSAAMTALNVLVLRARDAAAAPAPVPAAAAVSPQGAAPPPEPSAFMRRLPPRLRGAELYAVEAEDHYLRVHTDRGSDLLLMRLADALDELGPVEGARTHRSWWVARAAVADARRGDGRATLVLKDGAQVPVSRSYAPVLREAGWF